MHGDDETLLIMSTGTEKRPADLHPSPVHIFKLWQTFLENVNPLLKILHTPTIQPHILEAMDNPQQMNRELEALMFSIYCISVISLTADDVEKSFGESRKKLFQIYRRGAQVAFKNASLMRTSSLMVLQAFVLYIVCVSSNFEIYAF